MEAGANEIVAVKFFTTRLQGQRAEAGRLAGATGREKPENYGRAAAMVFGPVVSIEVVSPDVVRGTGEGHTAQEKPAGDVGSGRAFATGSVAVGAAMSLGFAVAAPAPLRG